MHITTEPGLVSAPVSYQYSGTHLPSPTSCTKPRGFPFIPISLKPPDLTVPSMTDFLHFSLLLLPLPQAGQALPFTYPMPVPGLSRWTPSSLSYSTA